MDTYRAILPHVSGRSLVTLAHVSKDMAALTLEEAIRRYFPSKKAYMIVRIRGFCAKSLTIRGAHYFLAGMNPRPIKLAHACASRDPDMIALALRTGATDYIEGCIIAAIKGDADTAIMLFDLWQKEPEPAKTGMSYYGLDPYFDEYIAQLTNGDFIDPLQVNPSWANDPNFGYVQLVFCAAYMGGNQTLIDHFTAIKPANWAFAIYGVCRGSRLDLVDWVFSEFPSMRHALIMNTGKNMPVIRYLVEKKNIDITDGDIAWNICNGRTSVADFLLSAPSAPGHLPESFKRACIHDQLEFVKRTLPGSDVLIRKGFKRAATRGHVDIMGFLSGHHAVNWDDTLLMICRGDCDYSMHAAVRLCIDNGATNLEAALGLAQDADDKSVAITLIEAMFA